jgi:exosome complex component RRP46
MRAVTAYTCRQVSCTLGALERADGSAQWCQGGTCVMAAVYGPLEAASGKENPEQAGVDVVFKPRTQTGGATEKSHEYAIRETIRGTIATAQHPRTVIQVVLQVVSDDGSLVACALNATCAALIDAGVPMHDRVVAISVAVLEDGTIRLDPSAEEDTTAAATGCFAFRASAVQNPILSLIRGPTMLDTMHSMVEAARLGCEQLAAFSRNSIVDSFATLPR